LDWFCSPSVIKTPTRFLVYVMFFNFQFTLFMLFPPTLDIKPIKNSQKIHFIKLKPLFLMSTFKCHLSFNQLIASWDIFPMFKSFFIWRWTKAKIWLLHKIKIVIEICLDVLWNNFSRWCGVKTWWGPS
jgi:hypothetical protein